MDCFIGTIFTFGFNYAPQDFAFCNGQAVSVNQYQALYGLISNLYGGNGKTDFMLPDLQSRVPVGFGQGAGLTGRALATKGGFESVLLRTDQVPLAAHTHSASFTAITGSQTVTIPGSLGNLEVNATVNAISSAVPNSALSSTTNQLATTAKIYAPAGGTQTALAGVSTTILGNASTADRNVTINNIVTGGTVTVGGNTETAAARAVPTVMPFLALNFCIALNGLWPSRP